MVIVNINSINESHLSPSEVKVWLGVEGQIVSPIGSDFR